MRWFKIFIAPIVCFLAFFLFFIGNASAQDIGDMSTNSFSVSLTPQFPAPFQDVTAQVSSSLINIDSSKITWVLEGKTQLQGIGKRNFTFKTGEVGSVTSLRVEVDTVDFGVVGKTIEIQTSDIDILWEANTYTPPFYKGKALPSSQSFIKVLGIPYFTNKNQKIDPGTLVYSWKKTYTPNPDDSGAGKNTYLYRGAYTFNDDTIETSVSSADGFLTLNKKTKISIIEPKIIFYESKPLEGTRYENALLGSFGMNGKEVTLRAEPYFFSLLNANNNIADFRWQLDGKQLETNPDKKSEFTLRKPDTGSGTAGVALKISNNGYDLQTATKNITLMYTNQ